MHKSGLLLLFSILFLTTACSDYIENKREGLKRFNIEERQEEDKPDNHKEEKK
ncbi:MAG: hypothetical protein NDI69_01930 [Bacteriovoracaceae bacterium]|nr:hypothetical protein [Bacteriovoracaceae bacterium]